MRRDDAAGAAGALLIWADWQRARSDLRELWYPRTAAGFASGGIGCYDDLAESLDSQMAQALDVIIEGLDLIERSAIHHHYLASVFRGREGVLEESLERAVIKIGRKLVERGLG